MHKAGASIDDHIGLRLEQARKSAGLTVDELAKRLGLDTDHVLALEAGTARASAAMLYRASRLLELELRWFFASDQCEQRDFRDLDAKCPEMINGAKSNGLMARLVDGARQRRDGSQTDPEFV